MEPLLGIAQQNRERQPQGLWRGGLAGAGLCKESGKEENPQDLLHEGWGRKEGHQSP